MIDTKHVSDQDHATQVGSIQEAVSNEVEKFRDRWLSTKLSLYGSFLTFSGLALASAALFAQTPASKPIAAIVIFLSVVSALCVFLQYYWLLRLFDALGFSTVSFKSEQDIEEYDKGVRQHYGDFLRRKPIRRFMDFALYVVAIAQVALLPIASCLL